MEGGAEARGTQRLGSRRCLGPLHWPAHQHHCQLLSGQPYPMRASHVLSLDSFQCQQRKSPLEWEGRAAGIFRLGQRPGACKAGVQ